MSKSAAAVQYMKAQASARVEFAGMLDEMAIGQLQELRATYEPETWQYVMIVNQINNRY